MKNANPVSPLGRLFLVLALTGAGCGKPPGENSAGPAPSLAANAPAGVVRYGYEVVKAWPHDREAFTQGLVFRRGSFLESTGLNGRSTLREVDVESGRILKQVTLPSVYFTEGLAVIDSQAFQLTWQNRVGFVYDVDTFQRRKEFTYEGEGWGLTTDGRSLLLSDGTSRIRELDPVSFAVTRTIQVTLDGKPVDKLNELEYVRGEIFANVWLTDEVVRIDPATGIVRGVIDFSGLLSPAERTSRTDVLNGIAYDPDKDRLFVTGKLWPRVFEVKLKPRP